jgi:uncharacterized protein
VRGVDYDLCVLTGDYRFRHDRRHRADLQGLAELRASLAGDVYAVLGNHDSVLMLPDLEDMGIRVLMNEHVQISARRRRLCLAGIDDAHFFGAANFEKALAGVAAEQFTAAAFAHARGLSSGRPRRVDLLLCGHTHGGQICLPGGFRCFSMPASRARLGRGLWRYGDAPAIPPGVPARPSSRCA